MKSLAISLIRFFIHGVIKLKVILFWFLFFWQVPSDILSQDKNSPVVILGAKVHYGFIIPHYPDLKPISETNPWGAELDVSRMMVTDKAWQNCNCYARVGGSFMYFNYQYPEVLGSSYNLVLFGEPYLGFRKALHVSLRGGIGVTYLTRVYDEVSNPENVFYSSPLSFLLLFQLSANYRLNEKFRIKLTANYNHISNGGATLPNKGMNFPTLSAGTEYVIHPQEMIRRPKSMGLLELDPLFYVRNFSSLRSVEADSINPEVRRLMTGLEGGFIKGLTNINGIGPGLEFSYDGSFKEISERIQAGYSPVTFSLGLTHAFIFGRFWFTQQFFWYAYRPFPANDKDFFQRYGLYFRLGKYLNLGASLKTHQQVAEHMDVRIGISF